MKKTVQLFIISLLVLGSFSGCTSMQTGTNSNAVLGAVKGVLTNGTSKAFNIFSDSNAFMTNALIEAALPKEIKEINTKLESLGLSHIVEKEKQYISQIANASITTARPIVKQAIEQMTLSDAVAIVSGGNGAATNYLRTTTETKLQTAISPLVHTQTEKLGVNTLLNNALGGQNGTLNAILGTVLGTGSNQNTTELLNDAITQQLIEGLFNIVEDVENDTRANPSNLLNSVLGTTTKNQ